MGRDQAGLGGLQAGDQQRQAQHARPDDPPRGTDENPRQTEQQGGHLPFQRAGQHRPVGDARLIEALEHPGPERPAIDDRHVELKALQRAAVHHPAPLPVAAAIELVGVLGVQQGLGLAIAGLLLEVRTRVLAAMMPDERPRREGDQEPLMLETPADIHVVAGLAKLGIEPVDRLEDLAAKSHVAAGDMLGDLVAQQDMRRLARCGRHARGQPSVCGGQVRPPHRRRPAPQELMDQVDQPVRFDHAVGIGVRDQSTGRARSPAFRAALNPLWSWWMARTSGNRARISRVSSAEPSSTTMTS